MISSICSLVNSAIFYLKGVFKVVKENEALVFSAELTNEQIDEIIVEEYNNAYNDILDEYEEYFTLVDEECAEPLEEQVEESIEETLPQEEVVEEELALAQEDVVEEVVETNEQPEVVEETKEELADIKVESLEDLNELNELLVQTDTKNDEKVAEQAENIKNQIENEKNALVKEREELEAYREAATNEIALLQAELDAILGQQEEVEEVAPVKKENSF